MAAYLSPYPTASTPGSFSIPGMENAQDTGERRRVRSVVVDEQFLGPPPEESVRYVEVPYVEEVVRHVPRKEVVEVEKRVPRYEYEWVDRVVEVPQIQYVEKFVEVPQVHEVIKHVSRREVVEVPREIVRHVPKVETKVVEKVVEIPGEIIEVPKPYTVENKIPVAQHVDKEVPMIVAQTLRPVLTETNDYVDVEVVEYEPEVIPVDIHVPRAVQSELISMGVVQEEHRVVKVPPAQYNSMLRMLNPHLAETDAQSLPYVTSQGGAVSFMGSTEQVPNVKAPSHVKIIGWNPPVQQQSSSAAVKSRGIGAAEMMDDADDFYAQDTSRQSSSRHVKSKQRSTTGATADRNRDWNAKRLSQAGGRKRSKGACPC